VPQKVPAAGEGEKVQVSLSGAWHLLIYAELFYIDNFIV
jgi:hypothetical protein